MEKRYHLEFMLSQYQNKIQRMLENDPIYIESK